MTVVVATRDFELYHDVVGELRERGVRFTTVEPGDPLPPGTTVVITGADDEPEREGTADEGTDGDGSGGEGAEGTESEYGGTVGEDAEGERAAGREAADGAANAGTTDERDAEGRGTDASGATREDEGETGATTGTDEGASGGSSGRTDDVPVRGDAGDPVETIVAEPDRARRAVEEALSRLRGRGGRTVIGIDPGDRPGIAVLEGDCVVAAFQVPVGEAASVVREELEGAVDPVVRIGDGARLEGARIVDDLDDARVELVDETGTTPSLGTGARGMGDVLAAVNIARLEGEVIENRTVEPTAGELQVIKDRSRERSPENRAIDGALARRVAKGELSIEDALEEHRKG